MEHRRLSLPKSALESHYGVVVVGSGYGGSIVASRLARAGQKVCLLERGREFLPGEFPDTTHEAAAEFQVSTPEGHIGKPTGLYDLHVDTDINVIRGCGLGGTSLINANVSVRADSRVFEDPVWPKALRDDVGTRLEAGFERAEEMLRPAPYDPKHGALGKLEALRRSAASLDAPLVLPTLNVNFEERPDGNHVGVKQHACNLCGDCVSGCNVSAKNTTAMTYLPDAYNHGASIFCEVLVDRVEQKDGKWRVYFTDATEQRRKFHAPDQFVLADLVVLAGGALGSTEILLRSARAGLSLSRRVGQSFSGNADVLAFGYNSNGDVNGIGWGHNHGSRSGQPPVGPCITGMIDLRNDKRPVADGMVIEEGVVPGALAAVLPKTLASAAAAFGRDSDTGFVDAASELFAEIDSSLRGSYYGAVKKTQTYLVMAHDGADGKLRIDSEDRLRLDWPDVGKRPVFTRIDSTLFEATKANGGTHVRNPLWNSLLHNQLVTVHPLGGCAMAEDAEHGVVDHAGQVFAGSSGTAVHAGLYVADGSIVPTSLGVNPLFTISALSERIAALIAEEREWKIDYTLPSAPTRAARQDTVGIEFTESMKGFFSTRETTDFQRGYDLGKADGSPMRFVLTIASPDVAAMTKDPLHAARMSGTVEAPALSSRPLNVSGGTFNLFVDNPDQIGTQNMIYRMVLNDEAGKQYHFHGYKVVRNDAGIDIWPDTTTLYVTIRGDGSEKGPIIGRGVLHISPDDFARQLTTMRATNAPTPLAALEAVASFGKLFARDLFDVYGGIVAPNRVLHADATPRKRRDLRTNAPTLHTFQTQDGVQLRLTRYNGGTKGPVLLAPGFGNSAAVYALDTNETSFTEYLYAHGYDVWLFDRRSSPRLASAAHDFTVDDEVAYDWPAAVAEVKRLANVSSVQAVAHCMGSMTLLLAIMTGMSGVRSAVCSQVTTYFHTELGNRIKASLKIADALKLLGIGTVTTNVEPNWRDAAIEAGLRLYPMPEAERCQSPVCHRIWGIFGPVYKHANMNPATHLAMSEIFGIANTTVLQHLLRILHAGHAVDKDGRDVYSDKKARLTLPIHFISGSENRMAFPKTTEQLYDELVKLHGPTNYSRRVFEGYAHLDCFIGRNSALDIYPDVLKQLNRFN